MPGSVKGFSRLALIVVLISAIMLPATSAQASSTSAASKPAVSYASSFFSSITNAISSLFHLDKEKNAYSDSSFSKGKGWFGWLKGKDRSDNDWWEDHKDDSYKIWERYYCY